MGEKIKGIGDKTSEVGLKLSTHVTALLVAMGGLSLAAFNEVDSGLDTIITKTGASGEALDGITVFLNVSQQAFQLSLKQLVQRLGKSIFVLV